ncbi:metallophosphoesterase [Occallatibacter riparius]|uniref:Metallophosphoesterase n=1 Tax=Occallatibacter riparius TaxID=1002689 RepID=A0A9J7BR85_9BACT|nr:metallophosphoesterase [Occallatibacter riparius]UWZ85388.1 metallophosphoesterase [Occallatibacter riparius]
MKSNLQGQDKLSRRLLLIILLLLPTFIAPFGMAQAAQPWFFAVLADPQLGMYAKDQNFTQESANLEFVVASLNRLHPRFVVVCGDLTNRTGDATEIAEYKRILQKLDPAIPVHNVPGNHDVGNEPTPNTLNSYRQAFGRDYYSFSADGILGIVLNSSLIGSPTQVTDEAQKQEQWLENTLTEARAHRGREVVVFQHIPYFLHDPAEKDDYFNLPASIRRKYLDFLERGNVHYVFAGHYHRNAGGKDGSLNESVSGAVGLPIGGSLSGFRLVTVDGSKLESRWYCLADIPNQVQPPNLPPTHCPQ